MALEWKKVVDETIPRDGSYLAFTGSFQGDLFYTCGSVKNYINGSPELLLICGCTNCHDCPDFESIKEWAYLY